MSNIIRYSDFRPLLAKFDDTLNVARERYAELGKLQAPNLEAYVSIRNCLLETLDCIHEATRYVEDHHLLDWLGRSNYLVVAVRLFLREVEGRIDVLARQINTGDLNFE